MPLARSMNSGTSKKLWTRGTEGVFVTHRITTVATGAEPRISAVFRSRSSGLEPISRSAATTTGIHRGPGTSATPSIQIRAGTRIWSMGAVSSHRKLDLHPVRLTRALEEIVDVRRVPPRAEKQYGCHAEPGAHAQGRVGQQNGRDREERDGEVRERDRSDGSGDTEGGDQPGRSRPAHLQRAHDHDTHCGEREPVAACLSRDVQEERRRGCEEEEDESRGGAEARVQPDRDERDTGDEREHREQAERDLGLTEQ